MIRGQTRPSMQRQESRVEARCNLHNRFDIEVVDSLTGEITQRAQAENIILNALWARLLAPNTYFTYIFYGTGSGTPAVTDTALFTHLGYGAPSTSDDVFAQDHINGVYSIKRKIVLSEATAVGSTLTEVGIAYGTTSTNLATHAMLKDMNGNTISIAKTDTDIINIYATLFVHLTAQTDTSISFIPTFVVNSSGYKGQIAFLMGLTNSSAAWTQTNYLTGGKPSFISVPFYTADKLEKTNNTVTFTAAEKKINISCARLAISDANIGGIGSIQIGCSETAPVSKALINLSTGGTWFPGTTITGEAIGTGNGSVVDFATDFPWVSSPTIYVDGVEEEDVTVDLMQPASATALCATFECVSLGNDASAQLMPVTAASSYTVAGTPTEIIFFNPHYATRGIASFKIYQGKVYCSDDLSTWEKVADSDVSGNAATYTMSASYQNKKYWKVEGVNYMYALVFTPTVSATNIHFNTAPANGTVITADYTTKTIAKDTNHVFDLTVTITLGEQTT